MLNQTTISEFLGREVEWNCPIFISSNMRPEKFQCGYFSNYPDRKIVRKDLICLGKRCRGVYIFHNRYTKRAMINVWISSLLYNFAIISAIPKYVPYVKTVVVTCGLGVALRLLCELSENVVVRLDARRRVNIPCKTVSADSICAES